MTRNKQEKKAAREYAKVQGVSYTQALKAVREIKAQEPKK